MAERTDPTLVVDVLDDWFKLILSAPPRERAPLLRTGGRQPIPQWVRQLVKRRDGYCCVWCGRNGRDWCLHIDHIKPWSAGGSDRTDNLRTLCERCNLQRSNYVTSMDRPALPIVFVCEICSDGFLSTSSFFRRMACWCDICERRSYTTTEARIQ